VRSVTGLRTSLEGLAVAVWSQFIDGYQAELVFVLDGKIVENRLWFLDRFGLAGPTEFQQLSDGIAAWHTDLILPFLSSDITLQFVEVNSWASFPPVFVAATPVLISGGVAEKSHSANVAGSVRFVWPSEFSRQRTNKNFVPGLPLSAVDLNTITPTYKDILFEAYAALVDRAATWSEPNLWRWMVVSLIDDSSVRSEALARRSIGPVSRDLFRLGQRRTRLPP